MNTKSKRDNSISTQTRNTEESPKKKRKPNLTKEHNGNLNKSSLWKKKSFPKFKPNFKVPQEKPDWDALKKEKKVLRLKRKQNKGSYDAITEGKLIAEKLRKKNLPGGKDERNKFASRLHELFGNKGQYAKLVFTHDMARVVQYLLKFGSEVIRRDISKEITPLSAEMLTSKYGRYCVKNLLKYGNNETRRQSIKAMYGHAIKLVSHVVSASVFEYIYSTWASPREKQHFIQEFFGEMYKQTKDDSIKELSDIYKNNQTMKAAALSSVKANLSKVLNKNMLDSGLIHSVLHQYFKECNLQDKAELIEQLAPHVVILSNSRDGVRIVMQCIWHGTNKIKKVVVKALKAHVMELAKHEHGHCSVITLLDAVDDTVLVNKLILTELLANVEILAVDEWGRKVLLWLVTPGNSQHFHPQFIQELDSGRSVSTCKKSSDVRRNEILEFSYKNLLNQISSNPQFWLSSGSIVIVTAAILKTIKSGEFYKDLEMAFGNIIEIIIAPDWKVKDNETELLGVEHPGLHMTLKKLIQHDKSNNRPTDLKFGKILIDKISEKTINVWLSLNRGCFLLLTVYENSNESLQKSIKQKLRPYLNFLKKQNSKGAEVLLKKLK